MKKRGILTLALIMVSMAFFSVATAAASVAYRDVRLYSRGTFSYDGDKDGKADIVIRSDDMDVIKKNSDFLYARYTEMQDACAEADGNVTAGKRKVAAALNAKSIFFTSAGENVISSAGWGTLTDAVLEIPQAVYYGGQAGTAEYVKHAHADADGNALHGEIIHAAQNPGGCYAPAGHTHDALGQCRKMYTKHVHTSQCGYEGGSDGCGCEVYKDWNGKCLFCGHARHAGSCSAGAAEGHYLCGGYPLNDGEQYLCGSPVNTYKAVCGYAEGEVTGVNINF